MNKTTLNNMNHAQLLAVAVNKGVNILWWHRQPVIGAPTLRLELTTLAIYGQNEKRLQYDSNNKKR
jgi:hypothetical protein